MIIRLVLPPPRLADDAKIATEMRHARDLARSAMVQLQAELELAAATLREAEAALVVLRRRCGYCGACPACVSVWSGGGS